MTRQRRIAATLFLAYALCVLVVTVVPSPRPHRPWDPAWQTLIHWIPFDVDPISMIANVVMFLPFGVLVPLIWPRMEATARIVWLGLAASLAIELTQFVFLLTLNSRRTVDVNDLIANAGGAVLGLWLMRLIRWSARAEMSGASPAWRRSSR